MPFKSGGSVSEEEKIQINNRFEKLSGQHLEFIRDISGNAFGIGVAINNYDEVHFDTFVDSSKILSSSNVTVTTGQNGNIKLLADSLSQEKAIEHTGGTVWSSTSSTWQVNKAGIISEVVGDTRNDTLTITIKDSDGNILAEKTTNQTGLNTVNFDLSDYSRTLEPGEEITLEGSESGYVSETPTTTISELDYVSGNYPTDPYGSPALKYAPVAYASSGTATSTTKALGFTPSKAIVEQKADVPNGADIQYVISDSSGNSTTVAQSDIGSEISVDFADGDVTVKPQLSTSDSSVTPTLESWGVYFV